MKLKSTIRLAFPIASAIAAMLSGQSVQADHIWNGGIDFTNDGSGGLANAFTLAINRITLGGNITTTANTAGSTITDTISLPMILNGNRIITTNQLSDTVQHNLTISGIISQDASSRSLTKAGLTNTTRTNRFQRVVNSNLSAATLTINNSTNYTFAGNLGSNAADGSVSTTAMGAGSTRGNNFGLTKNGTGAFILAGDNTFAGNLNIQNGIVKAGKNSTSAAVGPFGNTSNASVILANLATAGMNINGFNATVKDLQGGGALGDNLTLTTGNTLTINDPSSGSATYNGLITGDGNLAVNGSSRQTLNSANTYTGTTTLNPAADNVSLRVAVPADGGSPSGIGQSSADADNLILRSGIFEYNNTVTGSTNRLFTLGDNVVIQTNGTGAMNFNDSIAHSIVAAKTLPLSTSRSDNGTMTPAITDSGTGVNISSLTKNGANTCPPAGANTDSGNTIVNEGTLVLADNAQLKFVLGATSGTNNSISGAGTVSLEGDFVIDTTAADALASGSWTLENVPSLSGPYGANFTVVGFTNAGSDRWTKPNGAKIYAFDETTGILTLGPAGYASWIDGFFAGETNPLIIGTAADPDNDGIDNGTEMVLGGNPASGMDTALLPTIELVTDPPSLPVGNYLLFTYRRTAISETALVAAACETNTDLVGSWSTAVNGVSSVVIQEDLNYLSFVPAAPADTDRVRVHVPRGANTKLFGRLKVVVP